MKILAIDDDQLVLDILAKKLKEKNHEVITRTDPIKALGVIYSQDIEMIISDVLMPGVSGYALLGLLKQFHCQIPVILISSLDEAGMSESTQGIEVTGFVRKPIDFTELYEKIEAGRRSKRTA